MEMHRVGHFLALCETLNFSRAAETCNVSQPALISYYKRAQQTGALVNLIPHCPDAVAF